MPETPYLRAVASNRTDGTVLMHIYKIVGKKEYLLNTYELNELSMCVFDHSSLFRDVT